jgi:hypothetical protein
LVLVNGAALASALAAEVTATAFLCANRFCVTVAYTPAVAAALAALPLLVDVRVGLNGHWLSLISGNADSLDVDPIRQVAIVHGRDLSAALVDTQVAETFENQTAAAIVSSIAARHGLTAIVSSTNGLIGRAFQSSRTRSVLSQHASFTSEWDVLTSLAEQQNCDVWVDGTSLYFQPSESGAPTSWITPFDCTGMRICRRLDLAAGPSVVVKSWDSALASAVCVTASGGAAAGPCLTMLRPNLSAADATQLAERTFSQLTTHSADIEFDLPGELSLSPRMLIGLAQSGTDFDGTYKIVEVRRHFSFHHGFTQSVLAKALAWTASSML